MPFCCDDSVGPARVMDVCAKGENGGGLCCSTNCGRGEGARCELPEHGRWRQPLSRCGASKLLWKALQYAAQAVHPYHITVLACVLAVSYGRTDTHVDGCMLAAVLVAGRVTVALRMHVHAHLLQRI